MGLDTGFLTLGSTAEIAYLRNHRDFSNLFFEQDPKPHRAGYTDFLVDTSMIDLVAARLPLEAAYVWTRKPRCRRPSSRTSAGQGRSTRPLRISCRPTGG